MDETILMWEGEGGALESKEGGGTGEAGGEPGARIGQVLHPYANGIEPFNEAEWAEKTRKRLSAEFEHIRKLISAATRERNEQDREGTTLIARLKESLIQGKA